MPKGQATAVRQDPNLPSFKEWRRKNDAVMVPDRGFVKQLKKLDPDYEVLWDWGMEKWEIWCMRKDSPGHHVATVQTTDRSYRELGADVLLKLQAGDTTKFSVKELCDYFDELDNQVLRRQEQDLKNKVDSIVSETFNFARGVLQVQVPQKLKIGRAVANG